MNILNVDHSFHIGEQHRKIGKPCQDYALSGLLDEQTAYAIVSDGCSSGGMTDIGARLVALATRRALTELHIKNGFPAKDEHVSAINKLRDSYLEDYRRVLDLTHKDLLATCLWAVANKDMAFAHATGDGMIALQYEDELFLESFEWAKNMPFYPAYKIGNMVDSFKNVLADEPEPFTDILESTSPTGMGGIPDGFLSTHDVATGMRGVGTWWAIHNTDCSGNLQTIALFSDGVKQVREMSYQTVAAGLLAFKSTTGAFAVRRMNRFLKDIEKIGGSPIDDIAFAVIHIADKNKPT